MPESKRRQIMSYVAAGWSATAISKRFKIDRKAIRNIKRDNPTITAPRDAYGRPVPERLYAVFAARDQFLEIVYQLENIRSTLALMQSKPGGLDIDFRDIAALLESLRTRLLQATPLSPCDCPPSETNCPLCRGLRWVTPKSLLGQRLPSLENCGERPAWCGAHPREPTLPAPMSAVLPSLPAETMLSSLPNALPEHTLSSLPDSCDTTGKPEKVNHETP